MQDVYIAALRFDDYQRASSIVKECRMVRTSCRIYADDSEQAKIDRLRTQINELGDMLLKAKMDKEHAERKQRRRGTENWIVKT